jgi:hypothetical protein
MASKGYPHNLKLQAKALWIVSNLTDAQIAERLGITRVGTIGDWRKEEGWEQERQVIQEATEARVAQAVSETVAEMNTRHLKEYQLLQTKGVQALRRLDPQKAAEAQAMVDAGIRGERLVRGEPTEVREVRALMQQNVQVLEVVVADVIKALLEAGAMDQKAARRFAEEFASRVNGAPFRYRIEGS